MFGVMTTRPCSRSVGDRNWNATSSVDTPCGTSTLNAYTSSGSRVHAMRLAVGGDRPGPRPCRRGRSRRGCPATTSGTAASAAPACTGMRCFTWKTRCDRLVASTSSCDRARVRRRAGGVDRRLRRQSAHATAEDKGEGGQREAEGEGEQVVAGHAVSGAQRCESRKRPIVADSRAHPPPAIRHGRNGNLPQSLALPVHAGRRRVGATPVDRSPPMRTMPLALATARPCPRRLHARDARHRTRPPTDPAASTPPRPPRRRRWPANARPMPRSSSSARKRRRK